MQEIQFLRVRVQPDPTQHEEAQCFLSLALGNELLECEIISSGMLRSPGGLDPPSYNIKLARWRVRSAASIAQVPPNE